MNRSHRSACNNGDPLEYAYGISSGRSQYFINVKDNVFLDKANAPDQVGYCVFGQVIGGMDVVDRIRNVRTGASGGHQNVPVEDVMIKSVRVVR